MCTLTHPERRARLRLALSETSRQLPHRQIVEQVKVALLTGAGRGDMLPSIRDLKRDVGVSEALARRAYGELADQGIVTLIQGKGVRVNERLTYERAQAFLERYRVTVSDALTQAQRAGARPFAPDERRQPRPSRPARPCAPENVGRCAWMVR